MARLSPRRTSALLTALVLACPIVAAQASGQSLTALSAASTQAAGELQSSGEHTGGASGVAPESSQPEVRELQARGFMKGRFLVGAVFTQGLTPDKDLGSAFTVTPFFRTTPRRQGWGPSFGLNWLRSDVYVPVNGQQVAVGTARLRPVMAGIGYSINRGRLVTNFSMVGGYAINDARIDRELPPGYSASLEVKDAWVMRPATSLTFALTRRLALVGSVGYVISNPKVVINVTDPGGRAQSYSDNFMSHYVSVSMGAAFSIF